MCCGPSRHQKGFRHTFGCECGCESSFRHFISAKEEQERLQEYKDQLKKELAAVEEHLEEVKGK